MRNSNLIKLGLVALLGLGCSNDVSQEKTPTNTQTKQETSQVAQSETPKQEYPWTILPENQELLCDFVGVGQSDPRAFKVYKASLAGAGDYGLVEAIGEQEKITRGSANMRLHYFLKQGEDEKGIPIGDWICVSDSDPWKLKLEGELVEKVKQGKYVLEPAEWKYK